jgi:hypothetical protein
VDKTLRKILLIGGPFLVLDAAVSLAVIPAVTASPAPRTVVTASSPDRTCTWRTSSITFPGHNGSTSTRATEDSCHWYYHARAKCYRANGTHYYSNGAWRFSTEYASIAYCGSNEWLTRAWFQKFRNGKYYLVYP